MYERSKTESVLEFRNHKCTPKAQVSGVRVNIRYIIVGIGITINTITSSYHHATPSPKDEYYMWETVRETTARTR